MYKTMAPAVNTVHRGELATDIGPDVIAIPGHALLAVVKECDDHDVGCKDASGYRVVVQHRAQPKGQAAPV